MPKGTHAANSKITARMAGLIKWKVQHGVPPSELADTYGLAPESVRRIGRGEAWRSVAPIPPDDMRATADPDLPAVVEIDEQALADSEAMLRQMLAGEAASRALPVSAEVAARAAAYGGMRMPGQVGQVVDVVETKETTDEQA